MYAILSYLGLGLMALSALMFACETGYRSRLRREDQDARASAKLAQLGLSECGCEGAWMTREMGRN